jgi:hypothetical protein
MKLTICLVTKGREKYLAEVLDSFQPFLKDQNVQVLLIDNGSDALCKQKLVTWQSTYSHAVRLVRFETNDPRFSAIWPVILNANIDWIIMPGDDDQLQPGILAEWKSAVAMDPDLVAFATSAAVMNQHGSLTGEVISPTAELSTSKIERIAGALHEPAFVWPSLFFRASKVNPNVPASRYASDWWVGVNLLIAGNIKTSKSIGLNYRRHSSQESNLAPNRRKYFEGSLWLDALIRSNQFVGWVETLNDDERLQLWRTTNHRKPIYGDDYFAQPVASSLARVLMDSAETPATAKTIASELALLGGVFLRDGESITLVNDFNPILGDNPGNIRVTSVNGACHSIVETCKLMKGGISPREFLVSCTHSKKVAGAISIDCNALFIDNLVESADYLVNAVTSACETRGDFEVALSNGERASLLLLRSIKKRLPGKLKIHLRKLKNSKQAN